MFSNFKKFSISILAAFVLLTNSALLFPEPAHAGVPVLVDASIPDATKSIFDTILDALGAASKNAVIRMAGYAIRKVSYDSAVWLATGGKGQSPLSQTKDFGTYLGSVGDQAAGAALQELGKAGGLNLCKIPDIRVDAALKIGLRSNFLGPLPYGPDGQPPCTLSQWKDQWINSSTWSSKYGGDQIGKKLNLTLSTDDSPLGIYGAASTKINQIVRTQQAAASLQRQTDGTYTPKTDLAGNIIVPAELVKETAVQNTPDKAAKQNQEQLNATLASGDVKVIPAALTLFLDTLVGTAVKNFQDKGVLPFGLGCATSACFGGDASGNPELANEYYGLSGGGSVAVAQNFFDYLKTVKIDTINNYDILSQLNSCTEARGLYNCRVDDNLAQALKQAQSSQPITIGEALKTGLLHPDWLLISAGDKSGRNTDPDCYKRSYCQSNIQVLRQLRILPLGFEIAAKNSNPDHPWKLGDVVAGFNKCPTDPSASDVNSPFCHLIDPNWVLKAPPAKCNALAYGPNLLAEGVPDRMQECADVQTCVTFDGTGNCLDYGYCTREKNTWNFGIADTCSAQFATCRSFQDATGRNVAYLYRTLDSASCSQQSVGCNAYSLTQNAAGSWVAPGLNADGTNKGVYFNSKVQTSCSANSAGCSAFSIANASGQALFLKKAPDYLGCYDADQSEAAPGINWPQTQSDLAKITPAAACSQYAGACVPDEVNCNFYTPTKGGEKIPGRFEPAKIVSNQVQWNDQCDAKCSGYAAYREMPGNYANGQSVTYIIPSSGKTCTAQEDGCTAFTNLSTTEGGLEKSEYFTYLRACVSPTKDSGKHFVTYEGTSQGGFQLKTYTLVENKDSAFDVAVGAPKYFVKTRAELDKLNTQCSEQSYKAGTASPDCRQFNDDAGTIYYRLLAYTIPVSDKCTPYRLSNNEFITDNTTPALECSNRGGYYNGNTCQFCFQNGEYRDGSCFYDGLPGTAVDTAGVSRTCSAAVNTCRAYKGNNGNNIDQITNDTFDRDATAIIGSWTNGTIAAESTHVGESSLLYSGQGGLVRAVSMPNGESFDLSFWAKGAGGNTINIKIGEKDLIARQDVGTVSVSDAWNYYHVGPFEYTGATSNAKIVFGENAGRFYLDNVKLVRVKSLLYLVKSSLKVDAVCDSNQTDNLPGDALGCKAYTDQTNKPYYLTGFSYLCRDSAVGCTAVLDTKNTAGSGIVIRNVWLTGDENSTAKAVVGSDSYSCSIPTGSKGCYVTINGHARTENLVLNGVTKTIQDYFVQSTIYIGSDTPSDAPIYLVANQQATCNQVDLGCTLAGTQRNTPTGLKFVTTTIKNDPASYDTALCTNEAVGCQSYSDGNDTRFFKDPAVTGQKVCTYRTGVSVNGTQTSGWFWKGVGVCSNSATTYCTANADCGGSNTCVSIGDKACYPTYLDSGSYGIWSSANPKYQNFVGECPTNQNACTEFVDHNDNNQAYYLIKNSKLSAGDCSGQASQRAGCGVFDQTDNPNKFFNTAKLYTDSDSRQGALVAAPQNNDAGNDANTILKVTRDRGCGEWLSCPDGRSVFDANKGSFKYVCYAVSRCNADGCGPTVAKSEYSGNVLSEGVYRGRGLSWKDMDYSGFSLLGLYPIEELTEWNFNTSSESAEWHLVKKLACSNNNCLGASTDYGCLNNGASCGFAQKGMCKNNICVAAIDGSNKVESESKVVPKQSCRAYPEKDAPFPNATNLSSELNSSRTVIQAYSAAHFCSESQKATDGSAAYACDCNYEKIQYGDSITKYWNYFKPNQIGGGITEFVSGQKNNDTKKSIPNGICLGGLANGSACGTNADCGSDSTCQLKSKETKYLGFSGFCLEEDVSRIVNGDPTQHPCLTWWPNSSLQGVPDAYNQYTDAGFNPSKLNYSDGPFYCGAKKQYILYDRESLSLSTGRINADCDGNLLANLQKPANKDMSVVDFIKIIGHLGNRASEPSPDTNLGCLSQAANTFEASPPGSYVYRNEMFQDDNGQFSEQKLIESLCPPNFATPGKILKVTANTVLDLVPFSAEENNIAVDYECVLKNRQWLSSDNYNKDLYFDTAYKKADWCTTLYQAGDAGKNKAWTQHVWKEDISNAENFSHPTFKFSDDCNPFAATSLNTAIPTFGPVVVSSKCNFALPPDVQNSDSYANQNISMTPYLTKFVYDDVRNVQSLFQKATALSLTQDKVCTSYRLANYPSNTACLDSVICKNVRVRDKCVDKQVQSTQGVCADSLNTTDTICTSDADCGGSGGEIQSTLSCKFPQQTVRQCQNSQIACTQDTNCPEIGDQNASCTTVANSYHYVKDPAQSWDKSGDVGARPPTVVGIDGKSCRIVNGEEVCNEGVPGFSLFANNQYYTNEKVELLTPGLSTDIRFFMYADNNQMPIRKVTINWGDGTPDSPSSDYDFWRNRRGSRDGTCDTSAGADKGVCTVAGLFTKQDGTGGVGKQTYGSCKSNNDCKNIPVCVNSEKATYWGIQKDLTCDNKFQGFNGHIYSCVKQDQDTATYKKSCPVDREKFPDGCCVYKPKLQVKDNWGWSTGDCKPDATHPNGGCYDGTPLKTDETNTALSLPWLYYGDAPGSPVSVYVAPKS